MRKKREIIQEATKLLEYTADNHDIAESLYVQSGAMLALKWVLDEGPSPVERISLAEKRLRRERKKREEQCTEE